MLNRRQLLGSSLFAGLAGTGLIGSGVLAHRAMASVPGNGRKFVIVTNLGGWDPTRVFCSEFDNPNVDMERDAQPGTLGDLTFVDHMDRPEVRRFLERQAARTAFFNGIVVPSVSHENCLKLMMTGSTRQNSPDWGAVIAGLDGYSYSLPQVVAAGPSFPGGYGTFVTRTGTQGQLPGLLSGEILGWSDRPVLPPSASAEAIMDQAVRTRAQRAATTAAAKSALSRASLLKGAYSTALDRAATLKELMDQLSWTGSGDLVEQAAFATSLLSLGVSRVVTLQNYESWDSHSNNDATQTGSFEALFSGLNSLLDMLEAAPGTAGGATLADETVIVVLSEMGRTPRLNGNMGKDHWPYTAAMVSGPGVRTGVYGGYDLYYYGRRVNAESGLMDDENGILLTTDVFGATLLHVAGIDSAEIMPGVGVVKGALSG